jgi:hypothetical protein
MMALEEKYLCALDEGNFCDASRLYFLPLNNRLWKGERVARRAHLSFSSSPAPCPFLIKFIFAPRALRRRGVEFQ